MMLFQKKQASSCEKFAQIEVSAQAKNLPEHQRESDGIHWNDDWND